jgi:hypothetical protein
MRKLATTAALLVGIVIGSAQAASACFTAYYGGDCSGIWVEYCSYNQDGSNCCFVAHFGRYTNGNC